jgi:hypothetical protein
VKTSSRIVSISIIAVSAVIAAATVRKAPPNDPDDAAFGRNARCRTALSALAWRASGVAIADTMRIQEISMRNAFIAAAALVATIGTPLAAQAQGTVIIEDRGTVGGPYVGIPREQVAPFREYVVRERLPSYVVDVPVAVGTVLPEAGVTYYDVPQRFGETPYRYTVINEQPVLVNPRTRRIMQVVD